MTEGENARRSLYLIKSRNFSTSFRSCCKEEKRNKRRRKRRGDYGGKNRRRGSATINEMSRQRSLRGKEIVEEVVEDVPARLPERLFATDRPDRDATIEELAAMVVGDTVMPASRKLRLCLIIIFDGVLVPCGYRIHHPLYGNLAIGPVVARNTTTTTPKKEEFGNLYFSCGRDAFVLRTPRGATAVSKKLGMWITDGISGQQSMSARDFEVLEDLACANFVIKRNSVGMTKNPFDLIAPTSNI
ncbi:hypothetical protein DY000_02051833 [Brassica cretica]|uniref:Uncharacterized protein n=1 Tax=Brassica cretica TaxID=69181 RepID=A0ABQ7AIS5_BRACR|nr:hypothetical protein DY000_02051833 [Brassica cretica]